MHTENQNTGLSDADHAIVTNLLNAILSFLIEQRQYNEYKRQEGDFEPSVEVESAELKSTTEILQHGTQLTEMLKAYCNDSEMGGLSNDLDPEQFVIDYTVTPEPYPIHVMEPFFWAAAKSNGRWRASKSNKTPNRRTDFEGWYKFMKKVCSDLLKAKNGVIETNGENPHRSTMIRNSEIIKCAMLEINIELNQVEVFESGILGILEGHYGEEDFVGTLNDFEDAIEKAYARWISGIAIVSSDVDAENDAEYETQEAVYKISDLMNEFDKTVKECRFLKSELDQILEKQLDESIHNERRGSDSISDRDLDASHQAELEPTRGNFWKAHEKARNMLIGLATAAIRWKSDPSRFVKAYCDSINDNTYDFSTVNYSKLESECMNRLATIALPENLRNYVKDAPTRPTDEDEKNAASIGQKMTEKAATGGGPKVKPTNPILAIQTGTADPIDGPKPPDQFTIGGKTLIGLTEIMFNILDTFFKAKDFTVSESAMLDGVYAGKHGTNHGRTWSTLKPRLGELKGAINKQGAPAAISENKGYIKLEIFTPATTGTN